MTAKNLGGSGTFAPTLKTCLMKLTAQLLQI
ncbi:hypothetical protein L8106_09141 [Lyngbya sp. PCC 8106]|nr:hypothetical protein L8106_09141 [Lyngbya sp. PCC 8106]